MAGSQSQAKGKVNKAAGNVKETVGRATGNRKMQAQGSLQKTKGKVQDASGRADRKVRRAANSL